MRIDARTAKVIATIPLPITDLLEEWSIAAGEGGVWAMSISKSRLVKIDPSTNKVAGIYSVPTGATALRAGFGGLWATNFDTGTLMRLDPKTLKVVARIAVGAGPRFLAVGERGVWVLNQSDGTVFHVRSGYERRGGDHQGL